MNLGKYTLDIIGLLLFMIFTLVFTILLKKSHIEIPTKIKTGKYGSLALKTYPNINVYINIKHKGSRTHQNQFKYEFATSAFSCEQAEIIEYKKYFRISVQNCFTNKRIHHPIMKIKIILLF
jgi:hypothetical protein